MAGIDRCCGHGHLYEYYSSIAEGGTEIYMVVPGVQSILLEVSPDDEHPLPRRWRTCDFLNTGNRA